MKSTWRSFRQAGAGLIVSAMSMYAQANISAQPGLVNYTEGNVLFNQQAVTAQQAGHLTLANGQTLRTGSDGRAEILLTPGVFLRLGTDSEIRMVATSLIDTQVELTRGRAMVTASQLLKDNKLQILDHGVTIKIEKEGLYRFDADHPLAAAYDGKMTAFRNNGGVQLTKGEQLALADPNAREVKFNTKDWRDDLYAWSDIRAQYAAQASYASASSMATNGLYGPAYYGWAWNPFYSSWAYVPAGGYFYDPFGFGFYSPSYLYYGYPVGGYIGSPVRSFGGGFGGGRGRGGGRR